MPRSPKASARDPATSPGLLRTLAKQGCAREVAGNPNAPADLLLKLAARHFDVFLTNPVLPLLLLEDPGFCHRIPAPALRRLLRRAQLPEHFLTALERHPDREVRDAARLHTARSEPSGDPASALFAALCAEPVSAGQLGTLLRLRLVPAWMLEALAGSARSSVCEQVIPALRDHPHPDTSDIWNLYQEAGLQNPTAENPRVLLSPYLSAAQLTRLARGGPRARLAAATHPTTPPDILRRLASDPHRAVQLATLRNRATAAEVLWSRAGLPDVSYRMAILGNPCTPDVLIEQLAADPVPRVRAAALRHRLVNAAALDRLSTDPDAKVRLSVASHRATSPATLSKLSRDADAAVRGATARRLHLPAEDVDRLLHDTTDIRHNLAARRNLTEDQVVHMLCDVSEAWTRARMLTKLPRRIHWSIERVPLQPGLLREALREAGWRPQPRRAWQPPAARPVPRWQPRTRRWRREYTSLGDYSTTVAIKDGDCSAEDYALFAANPDAAVRVSLANHYQTPPEYLHLLATDPVQAVRERLAFNISITPETAAILARDTSARVRQWTASNRATPVALLVALADDTSVDVRTSVISNVRTPEEIVRRLYHAGEPKVRAYLRHNLQAPGDLLALEWEQPGAPQEVLIQHACIPRALLEAALTGPSLNLRSCAAVNKALTEEDLRRLYTTAGPEYHTLLAGHPSLPPDLAASLAGSSDNAVLTALAYNGAMQPETLLGFVESSPLEVAMLAAHNPALTRESLLALIARVTPEAAGQLVHSTLLTEADIRYLAAILPTANNAWFVLLQNPAMPVSLIVERYLEADPAERPKFFYSVSPAVQEALIAAASVEARREFAWYDQLCPAAIRALMETGDEDTLRALAPHPRLDAAHIRALLAIIDDRSRGFVNLREMARSQLVLHPRTPVDLRTELARAEMAHWTPVSLPLHRTCRPVVSANYGGKGHYAHTSHGLLLGLLRYHQDVPLTIFEPMLDSGVEEFEHAFLDRPDLPGAWRETLRQSTLRRAADSPSLLVRLCALIHPDCSAAVLTRAAAHGRWLERYALTQNPAAAEALLAPLADDTNVIVREAARAALQRSKS